MSNALYRKIDLSTVEVLPIVQPIVTDISEPKTIKQKIHPP